LFLADVTFLLFLETIGFMFVEVNQFQQLFWFQALKYLPARPTWQVNTSKSERLQN